MKKLWLLIIIALLAVSLMPVAASGPTTMTYPDFTLSGGYQYGHFSEMWDLTACDLTLSFTVDLNGMVDDFGGSAHAWSAFGVRQFGYGDFNPTWMAEGAGVWLATDFDWNVNTFDPDPPGAPTQDIDDKLILQKGGGMDESYYNLPSTPPNPWANHGFWFDRDGVDQWQAQMWGAIDGGTYNTGGLYDVQIALHADSASSGTAFMTINGVVQQGFYVPNWHSGPPDLYPAGMTFTGDMTQMQVFYGLYGYGATHSAAFTGINADGCLGSQPFPGLVRGRVTDSGGTGIVNATVNVGPVGDGWLWVESTQTVSGGNYAVVVPPGTYIAQALAPGYAMEFYNDAGQNGENADPVVVQEGQYTTNINFALNAGGSISGTVYDQVTGDPIPDMVVSTDDIWLGACTDQNGFYTLGSLPLNTAFTVWSGGGSNWCGGSTTYLTEWWQEAYARNHATPITLPPDNPDQSGFDFTLLSCINVPDGDVAALIAAIQQANAQGSGAICLAQNGRYTLYRAHNRTNGSNGLPVISGDIIVYGNGATIVRYPCRQSFRFFNVAPQGQLVLRDLTLRGGEPDRRQNGAALYNRGAVVLENVSIRGGYTSGYGGAVYNAGTLAILGGEIRNNHADRGGGGVYNVGEMTADGVTFRNNSTDRHGGMIYNAGTVYITASTLHDSDADGRGGCLYNSRNATAEVEGSTFSACNADGAGGGIFNDRGVTLTVTDTAFDWNNADSHGGAIYNSAGVTASVVGGSFTSNHADGHGGGIYHSQGGTLTITDSRFATNNASGQGSSIYNQRGTAEAHNSCFENNTDTSVVSRQATLDAVGNWWGHPLGPSGAGDGFGDWVSNTVLFEPFLTEGCPLDAVVPLTVTFRPVPANVELLTANWLTDGGTQYQGLPFTAPSNTPFEVLLDLGNSSGAAQTVTVTLSNAANDADLIACEFTIPPYTATQGGYALRGRTHTAWTGIRLEMETSGAGVSIAGVSAQYRTGMGQPPSQCTSVNP